MTLGLIVSFLVTFLLLPSLLSLFSSNEEIGVKDTEKSFITSALASFAKNNKIENIKIKYNIENFYMNDSISRSSETMAKCTKDILNKAA